MKFEIEVSTIERGDVIPVSECERITKHQAGTLIYAQSLMYLCKFIENELWKVGKQFTVIIRNDEIRVLTHLEASEFAESTFEAGKRKMRLAHRRACAVDLNALPSEHRQQHLTNIAKMGSVLSSIRKRVLPEVTPVESRLPSMRRA